MRSWLGRDCVRVRAGAPLYTRVKLDVKAEAGAGTEAGAGAGGGGLRSAEFRTRASLYGYRPLRAPASRRAVDAGAPHCRRRKSLRPSTLSNPLQLVITLLLR